MSKYKEIKAALLGAGTVGSGVYKLVERRAAEMPDKVGAELKITKVLVKNLQKKISIVFQDYTTSANPRFRIRDILAEGQRAAARKKGIRKLSREKIKKGAGELMEMVGLSSDFLDRYPHELSGGQLQRVCIARAVACEPEIILFDEAISSLDAHTQVQVMDLLIDLKEKLNLTYVFITHDLTSVTYLCDEVLFLYRGHITECRPVRELGKTTDEYARRLLQAIV